VGGTDRDGAGDHADDASDTGGGRYAGGGDARYPRHTRHAGYAGNTRRDTGYAWDARKPSRVADGAGFGDTEPRTGVGDLDGELRDVRDKSPDFDRDEQE